MHNQGKLHLAKIFDRINSKVLPTLKFAWWNFLNYYLTNLCDKCILKM